MVTIKLLGWILVISGFVYYQWFVIVKRKSRPFYLLDFIFKGIAFILYGAWVWNAQNDIRTVNLFLWCVTSYWLLFDMALGVVLHTDPLYIGPQSGWIDRLGTKYPLGYWILKLLALFVLCVTTINIYKWQ